jgi:2-methylcitrate dehydratase PrpD
MSHAPHLTALAGFAASLRLADVPAGVQARARWILTDTVGCIVAGNRATPVRRLARADGNGEASWLGTATGLPRAEAAWLNGVASTWLDLDEGNIHTKGHAGVQIVPAAFAEAEAEGHPGERLLLALIAAYEVGCRVYGAADIRLAVHPHGTYGPMAAAVALGVLRGIGPEAMADVISVAAGLGVAASRQTLHDGASVRNAYTGLSARNGFLAHDLVRAGITGEADPFASVFGRIYGTAFRPEVAIAGLGAEWQLMRNYFKLHPSARYVHSALDLVDALKPGLDAGAIETIAFDTYAMAATMASADVATPFGTRFSVPFAIAARLLGRESRLDAEGIAPLDDPAIHALAACVTVREVADFTAAYPQRQPSRMRIIRHDGSVLEASADFIAGEAERPHPEAAMAAKFLALTTPAWGHAATPLLQDLLRVDTIGDIRHLAAMGRNAAAERRGA